MTNECPKCRTVPRLELFCGKWLWVCNCPPERISTSNNRTPPPSHGSERKLDGTQMIPPLDESLRDLLAKYIHAYGPNEMIAELQSVIDGIRDVQELDAQTVYTPVNTSNERTADRIGWENKSDDTDAYARWRA